MDALGMIVDIMVDFIRREYSLLFDFGKGFFV